MYKQSSGRNNRSKGFKIKHAIQLFVLVAICIWLIYQVKHSHDKKKEFDEKNLKTATSSLSNGAAGDEVIKLGRKDVQARFEKTTLVTDGKIEEAEGHKEDNTNKENEQEEEEDIKSGEKEDEGREGGDDEIDESDQHKFDMELEREESLIDEKDAEGKDTEDREDSEEEEGERRSEERENSEEEEAGERRPEEKENSGEEGEKRSEEEGEEGEKRSEEEEEEGEKRSEEEEEEGEKKSEREEEDHDHEAREEHYKADDASSAVAHETERDGLEKLSEQSRTEEEQEEVNARGQNSAQGNQTAMGNDIPQNDATTNDSIISNLNLTMKMDEKGSELVNDPNSQEDLQEKSDLRASRLEEEEEEGEITEETNSQKNIIVHESLSKVNTTTEGAKELLDHSNMHSEAAAEGGEAVGEAALNNNSGSEELESGKEMDPKSEDSSVSDPIDSLDSSSSSSHLEKSLHTTTEGNNKHQDDAAIM